MKRKTNERTNVKVGKDGQLLERLDAGPTEVLADGPLHVLEGALDGGDLGAAVLAEAWAVGAAVALLVGGGAGRSAADLRVLALFADPVAIELGADVLGLAHPWHYFAVLDRPFERFFVTYLLLS